ncbi:undecaprenyldiphospho-muramoylpentapeptide beta-N-acetylglucosaminyltransferase [Pseudalkalibacillus caeni]|uniref:UDP-N-acetylglucosamine--N-acetylmuramyl-(pentapeptide) pyrophosphoryl-undecaprenol N-acetylglucosamine transferase n=1 Tax=Exobacillus caeni TaxID=2574798 RepID=A0A5R9EYF3_9BACL|nr:undecaprenyldiphospho-muramoylpentapeptide beta-N-acetylglucosaminyltransferase [Pseudalkalibacillus caeni]TLS36332.1 undecaprenyldiphospho-muramoylpentapeptide beta-N-acetylglucosaminyltransferase [Pseudalkalibacillus caeni]
MNRIVFTGGGSAGHVTPNLAIIPELTKKNWDVYYIGSKNGIEKKIIEEAGIPYYGISSGKLRRYFDIKNLQDPFRVVKGIGDAYFLIRRLKPDAIFSKGGFVSVPVVIAGWLNRVPVFIHESDYTPGLANKIATKFASKIFVTFEESRKHLPEDKTVYTGSPIRKEILTGKREKGLKFAGFSNDKPVITVMGGSLGARRINSVVRENLDDLLTQFQIIHICGKGNMSSEHKNIKGYKQFEYISSELPDVMAATDLVISRAGSNSIFEFLTLKKPMLLIPLPRSSSRGDQILNAESFEKKDFASVLFEENLTKNSLYQKVNDLYQNRDHYLKAMKEYSSNETLEMIVSAIEETKSR